MLAAVIRAVVYVLAATTAVLATSSSTLVFQTGTWTTLGTLLDMRKGATATLLTDGRILVVGGRNTDFALDSVESLTPDGIPEVVPHMAIARAYHTATRLKDGRVLVTGGTINDGAATPTAELFNPVDSTWTLFAMNEPRVHHTATLLDDGHVLIVGGDQNNEPSATTEIFDPQNRAFTVGAKLPAVRTRHAAAILPNHHVLITGGWDGQNALATTDIFDPEANSVRAGPPLQFPRFNHTATELINGDVLIAGGTNGTIERDAAERFVAERGELVPSGTMTVARHAHLALRLPDNSGVLLVGGLSGGQAVLAADMYLPASGQFQATGATTAAHSRGVLSEALTRGVVVVAGGQESPATEKYQYATVKSDRGVYPPGAAVQITGTGWVPGETVTLQFREEPTSHEHAALKAVADAKGAFATSMFVADSHTLRVRFFVTARGSASEAQATFIDSPLPELDITSVNSGTPPTATVAFPVVVSVIDATGSAMPVLTETTVKLAVASGTGNIGGTVVGVVPAGGSTVTLPGVTYSKAETGVVFSVMRMSGDGVESGVSRPFPVGERPKTPESGSHGDAPDKPEPAPKPSNAWTASASLTEGRADATATLLYDGSVLIVGGTNESSVTATAERYFPTLGKTIPAGSMSLPRKFHTATLLFDSRVLVTGGVGADGQTLSSAEIYDPSIDAWQPVDPLFDARSHHTATLLRNGRVLIAVVTVVRPGVPGVLTGGGRTVLKNTAGAYASAESAQTSYGFDIVLADGANARGRFELTVHAGQRMYQFEVQDFDVPVVSTDTVTLTGRATEHRWREGGLKLMTSSGPDLRVRVVIGLSDAGNTVATFLVTDSRGGVLLSGDGEMPSAGKSAVRSGGGLPR